MEQIYKGLTRPAMIFGVPMLPFSLTMALISLLALWINNLLIILIVPAIFILKILSKKDENIFRLLFLKFRFITNPISKKNYCGFKGYSAMQYSKTNINSGFPKLSLINLDINPNFEKMIPYQTLIDNIVITKDYDFIATWEVKGVPFELEDDITIETHKLTINYLIRQLSNSNISFYFHNCRVATKEDMKSDFKNSFLAELDEAYYQSFHSNFLKENKLFFTAVYSPLPTRVLKSSFSKDSVDKRIKQVNSFISDFKKSCNMIEENLSVFKPERLGIYSEDGIEFSKQLEFYNFLISGNFDKVRKNKVEIFNAPLYDYLNGNLNSIMFNNHTTQLNYNNGNKRFAKAIEIKDYPGESFTGIIDNLMYLNVEYIVTQSFTPLHKVDAQKQIKIQQKRMISAEDDAFSQITAITNALDDLSSGEVSFGSYHFSIVVFGNSIVEVEKNTDIIVVALGEKGFLTSIANIALPATYFSQFPSNFSIRPRIHTISSLNYSSFISMHNFPKGRKENNQWGDAVTMLKTSNGQPYFFNFHEVKSKNDFGDFILANTLILGQSGGGKTALMNFLLNQLQKFTNSKTFPKDIPVEKRKATFFYLDKDKGAIGNIIASGGKYITIDSGKPTGFNPFMVESNAENIRKIQVLMKMLVTRNNEILTTLEENNLNNAVISIMNNFEIDERKHGISLMLEHLTESANETNSLKSRLALWSKGKKFGWVFDNEIDELNFNEDINIYAIDGTDLLKDDEINGMVAFYILWRIMDLTDGRRFALFIDEAWDWIRNEVVAKEVFNKLKTIRKQNGFIVLGTQSVEDFSKSSIATAVIEQSSTILLLSNPKGRKTDYVDNLHMSEEEYDFVINTIPSNYRFIIKKANERAIATIDLKHIGKTNLKIISTGSAYVEEIEKINNKNICYQEKLNEIKKLYS